MASAPGSEFAAAMLRELLEAATDGAAQGNAAGDSGSPLPNQVMLIYPLLQQAVMLQGDVTEFLMGGGNPGVPPASKAAIKGLRTVEAGQVEKEESCPVCLDEYGVEREVKEMPCRHRFHDGCIEQWLGRHGSCPVCRFEMQGEQEQVSASAMQVDEPEIVVTMEAGRSSGWGEGWTDFDHTRTVSALIEIWQRRASGGPGRVALPVEGLEVEERRATDPSNGWERDHTRTISALIELWQRRATGEH